MGKHREKKANQPLAKKVYPWSPSYRMVVSGLLVLHIGALFVGPCASPPPSSEWARKAEGIYEPYLRATFLKDHGYRFFAPNPGPSHLVRYELFDGAGELTTEGKFPDLQHHWPRLYYHRHFMISESLFNIANPVANPPDADAPPDVQAGYEAAKSQRDAYLNAISEDLIRMHPGATKVRLYMVEHAIPLPEDVAKGRPLGDPDLYREVPLGEFAIEEASP